MKRLTQRIRDWLGITAIESENQRLHQTILSQAERISRRIEELDKLTAIDADVGSRGPCTIILSGVYRGKGYVTFYELDINEFHQLVEEFRHRRRAGHLRNIDAPADWRAGAFIL